MPFYDLKCKSCGKEFNIYASISQRTENEIKCPKCNGIDHDTIFGDKANIHIKKSDNNLCPKAHRCGGCCVL